MDTPATVGRIVHLHAAPGLAAIINSTGGGNGTPPVPTPLAAVIVRVWSPTMVNLKVITDGPTDVWATSVGYGEDPAAELADGRSCWTWPPRA